MIDASPTGDLTFLVTGTGTPYTVWGFGNWFRDRCVEAGVPGRAHGLRKAGAATAAENGATTKQLMAIFGWLTLEQAEIYVRAAQREKLALDAMGILVRRIACSKSNKSFQPGLVSWKLSGKKSWKFNGGKRGWRSRQGLNPQPPRSKRGTLSS